MTAALSTCLAKRTRGYSLVEILVTIIIIAILSLLLFPASKRVLESSRATKCASNLRQISVAALNWSSENDNAVLICDQDGSGTALWPTLLAPYLQVDFVLNNPNKQPSVFRCPASQSSFPDYEKNAFFISYRSNSFGSSQSYNHFGKYTMIKNGTIDPAAFPIIVDGAPRKPKNWRGWFGFSNSDKDLIGFYHNNRANRLFLDGHIDSAPLRGWSPMNQANWSALGYTNALPTY